VLSVSAVSCQPSAIEPAGSSEIPRRFLSPEETGKKPGITEKHWYAKKSDGKTACNCCWASSGVSLLRWRPSSGSTLVIFPHPAVQGSIHSEAFTMNILIECLIIQFCVAFGVAGLFWPDQLLPLFDLLMFPWAASYRSLRANSLAAIALSVLLLSKMVVAMR